MNVTKAADAMRSTKRWGGKLARDTNPSRSWRCRPRSSPGPGRNFDVTLVNYILDKRETRTYNFPPSYPRGYLACASEFLPLALRYARSLFPCTARERGWKRGWVAMSPLDNENSEGILWNWKHFLGCRIQLFSHCILGHDAFLVV